MKAKTIDLEGFYLGNIITEKVNGMCNGWRSFELCFFLRLGKQTCQSETLPSRKRDGRFAEMSVIFKSLWR